MLVTGNRRRQELTEANEQVMHSSSSATHQQAYARELDDSLESVARARLLVCTVIYLPAVSVSSPCMLADPERLAMAV